MGQDDGTSTSTGSGGGDGAGECLISVVVPTWNRGHMVRATLDSLAAQTLAPGAFQIVVVDDGSTDDTADVARRFATEHPRHHVTVLRQDNGGVNAARNTGIRGSVAPIVCFLDDDELAPTDHLERVVELLRNHPAAAGVGGPAIAAEGAAFPTCPAHGLGDASLPVVGVGPFPRLLGGNMALRAEVVAEVGPFDEDLSGRGDENEWFHRADREFVYDDSLPVLHRRDGFTLMELCRTQFRQGRSVPLAAAKMGRTWRPSALRFLRALAHALFRRCKMGYLIAARECGGVVTWLQTMIRRSGRARRPRVERGSAGRP